MLEQNRFTCSFAFDQVSEENAKYRLNEQTASVGFIYRHVAETLNTFGQFMGLETDVLNTTLGQIDTGQEYEVATSRELIKGGYASWEGLIRRVPDGYWLEPVETPFFGTVSRIRLFAHVLYHCAHHAGQISSAVIKGKELVGK